MHEFQIINKFFSPLSYDDALSNDGFIIDKNSKIALTKDIIIEGVHFLDNTDSSLIASKALRVNLSDLASMGANPYAYMIGLALNRNCNIEQWLEKFSTQLSLENKKFDIKLIGGDTTFHNGVNIVSITAIGLLDKQIQELKRSEAKVGDLVCVTGTIGDSALGLMIYNNTINYSSDFLRGRYNTPIPRLDIGKTLLGYASSCIDISDGLLQDAEHICRESNVGMMLYDYKVPISNEAKEVIFLYPNISDVIFNGGDDYELLFTISPHNYELWSKKYLTQILESNVSIIGSIEGGNSLTVLKINGNERIFTKKGFIHK